MKRIVAASLIVLLLLSLGACSSKKVKQPEKNEANTEIATEAAKSSYTVGDTYEGEGVKVTVQSCEVYEHDSEYVKPDEGNIYIRVFIIMENTSDKDKSVGTTNFECYADSKAIDTKYLLVGDELTALDSISSGRSVEGAIYYEVPKESKVELEYSTKLVGGDKIIFDLTF